MRTKTLLAAAAALVAGLLTSQAAVTSANIVGYANLASPAASTYYLMTIPFAVGASNGANEVFGNNLTTGTEILTWSVGSQSFTISFYDSGTTPNWWDSPDENFNVPTPVLMPGQGFFLLPFTPMTNTIVGSVPVNTGTNVVISMPNASSYYLVGAPIPYAGAVTNGNNVGGGVNLNGLPTGSEVLTWSVGGQAFSISFYDSGTTPSWWDSPDENFNVPTPSVNVGEGFFVLPFSSYTWTNGLPAN
jgi:hypothetical protein